MNNRTRRKIKLSRYATVLGAGGHDPSVRRSVTGSVLHIVIKSNGTQVKPPINVPIGRGITSVSVEMWGGGGWGDGVIRGGSSGTTFVSSGGGSGYTAHAIGGAGGSHATDHCGAGGRCDVQSLAFLAPTVVGDGRAR